jgi:hypothetical protein
MNDSVLIVAKGPSAVNTRKYLSDFDKVATINDSVLLIPGEVDYTFFLDFRPCIFPCLPRTRKVVCRSREPLAIHSLSWTYVYGNNWNSDRKSMQVAIDSGNVYFHHTTTLAIHWLAKVEKFSHIGIIGVDGGTTYAEDVFTDSNNLNELQELSRSHTPVLDQWRSVCKELCELCTEAYGTKFTWLS